MTFEELEQRLPNGFHDAAIRETTLDKDCRTICRVLAFNHLSPQTAPTLIGSRHLRTTPD
jgi:hypothetical protein